MLRVNRCLCRRGGAGVVSLAAVAVFGCNDPAPQQATPSVIMSVRSIATVPGDDGDRTLIEHMRKNGVDLVRPHLVDFIFVAPSRAAAKTVCDELAARDHVTVIEPPGARSEWVCRATRPLTVTLELVTQLRAEHGALAAKHGAELDGWELDPR
jgi:hypothetical protein